LISTFLLLLGDSWPNTPEMEWMMKLRRDSKKDGAAQASVSSARKTRTWPKHVGDEEQDSGGSLNLAADFHRRSLPCTTSEKFFQNRRTSLPRAGVPTAARSLGPRRRRRQVGGEIDGDPAGLAPSRRPTATARSLSPPEGLAGQGGCGGRGGGVEIGEEAGWSGWSRVGVQAGAGRSGRSSSGWNPYIGGGWL
jgi:hypothetical protein